MTDARILQSSPLPRRVVAPIRSTERNEAAIAICQCQSSRFVSHRHFLGRLGRPADGIRYGGAGTRPRMLYVPSLTSSSHC
jgi:hypothetical protein